MAQFRISLWLAIWVGYISLLAAAGPARADNVRIYSTPTLRTVLEDLGPDLAGPDGQRPELVLAAAGVLKQRIQAGESFDLAILLPGLIDDLVQSHHVRADSRVDLARANMGIAVHAGSRRLELADEPQVRAALLGAKHIAWSAESASGAFFRDLIRRLGIDNAIQARIVTVTGHSPVDEVAGGGADMTVITVPNIVGVPMVELGGVLPPSLQSSTTFTAAIAAAPRSPAQAARVMAVLRSANGQKVLRARGFDTELR